VSRDRDPIRATPRPARPHDATCLRDRFDVPSDIAYFDTAAYGLMSHDCRKALEQATVLLSRPWLSVKERAAEAAEFVRATIGALIRRPAADVALVRSVSAGIAVALRTVPIASGERILRLAGDHPSITLQCERRAREAGGVVVVAPDPGPGAWAASIFAALGPDEHPAVAAILLTPLFWTNGKTVAIRDVVDSLRARGDGRKTAIVIDATHGAGVVDDMFADLNPDFVVFPAFKWLLGPVGLAFLVAAPRRQTGEPSDLNGFNALTGHDGGLVAFRGGAARYDMGERDSPSHLLHAAAALKLLATFDRQASLARLQELADAVAGIARRCGYACTGGGPGAPHIIGLTLPGNADPSRTALALRERGVFASVRGTSVRLSLYLHNDWNDIDRFEQALTDLNVEDRATDTLQVDLQHRAKIWRRS